jgi:hypothetical protein
MNLTEKNRLLDKISLIILMGIFFEIFLYGVHYCFTERIDVIAEMPYIMLAFAVIFVLIAVGVFVYAKKKNRPKSKIYGYEFIGFAILCPIITYLYLPKFYGLKTNFLHSIFNYKVVMLLVFLYFAARVITACVLAYKNSNAYILKKKRAKRRA